MCSKKKTVFNPDWTNPNLNHEWAEVFKEIKGDPFSAYCKLCSKSFSLSNMGRSALTSHQRCSVHLKKVAAKQGTPSTLLVLTKYTSDKKKYPQTESNDEQSVPSTSNSINDDHNLPSMHKSANEIFFTSENVLEAEILWALHSVESHMSLNSINKTLPILKLMFKGCSTAEKLKLSSKKLSYVITYGLAIYFREELEEILLKCSFYVACFDESLNRISQKGQMDVVIRYWDEHKMLVQTRYANIILRS